MKYKKNGNTFIYYYAIIIACFLTSCKDERPGRIHSRDLHEQHVKTRMRLDVEIRSQGNNGYTIVWHDTLGTSQNLDKFERPFHIVCDIIDQHDTAGYYHGLRNPSTWTSYGTKDSIITVYFAIARNTFSEMPSDQQMEYPDISCKFVPVKLNTRSRFDEKTTLILTEQ